MLCAVILFQVVKKIYGIICRLFRNKSYLCAVNKFVSFSKHLTRRIVLLLTLTLSVLFAVLIYLTAMTSYSMQKSYFNSVMDVESEVVEGMLSGVELSVRSNVSDIEHALDSPEKLYDVLKKKLPNHPNITYFFAAFEPNYYPEEGRWFEPGVYRDGDSIIQNQVGSATHDYLNFEWYQKGLQSENGYWSDPYIDGTSTRLLICSFVVPIHDATGRRVGVFGGDVSLDWLRQQLRDIDNNMNAKYNNSHIRTYGFITSNNGTYIAHPDQKRILKDKFTGFVDTSEKVGVLDTKLDGRDVFVFFEDLQHTGWMIGFAVPKRLVWMPVVLFAAIMLIAMVLGLLAVAIISRITIYRSTSPLQILAKSADEVAKGNFNAPLPQLSNHDEISLLRDSFGNMQQSLTRYIDELKSSTAENAAFENEMTNARDIQMAMVPNQFPPFPERHDVDIFGRMEPAKSVGGDLYDFVIRNDHLFFCIGDVSGKGVAAALLMAVTRSLFHSIAVTEQHPKRIMMRLNRAICDRNEANMFVTMFIGMLNLRTGHLNYCSAGHELPLLSGQTMKVKRNLPLGVMLDWDYEWQDTTLKSGDTLFLYTDGLNDAENAAGERFGRKRVANLMDGHTNDTAQQLAERVTSEIQQFVGDTDQSDDLTMLIIKWQQPIHLSIRADMDDIEQIDPFIAEASQQAGLAPKDAMHMRLALEEAVANVINYSQATFIDLDAFVSDTQLKVTITDDGIPFDATAESPTDFSLPPDQRPPGGLGMMFLHQMTDQLDYQRIDNRNVLTIVKTFNLKPET